MGITGLLPFLEKASSRVHLKDIRGCTVAIDTYCWLHKGVFACADKLVRGQDTDQYIAYCLKYIFLLLSYDIKPILVFDGQHLPAKALTESRRRESRKQSKQRAAELLRLGKIEEARSHMRRCVDVTHEMALRLIQECRRRNVDCIVAPYEADAQMAWLNKVNLAQYIITEDSDLTLFGARKIIFKLDLTGAGVLVDSDKLHLAMGCRPEKYTFDKFRRMCILSGCDYLDSLPGIGLAKACKFILKTEEDNMWRALKKIPQYLNMKNLQVDNEYIDNFLKAEATFKHMIIYNPINRRMERLNDLKDFDTEERYCSNAGTTLENHEQALNLALGNLNPFTLKELDNWHPDRNYGLAQPLPKGIKRAKQKSIWQANYVQKSPSKLNTNAPKTSCALYFKKVDFISKTIDEEISANLKEESAKPEEAEIFSMYKYGITASEASPVAKRCRLDSATSTCSSDSINIEDITNTDEQTPTKLRHNPFAKVKNSVESPEFRSAAAICENSSLLKVLSPKKCKEEWQSEITQRKKSSFRRSIFASTEAQVEVKSRFFAENIKQANKQLPPSIASIPSDSCKDKNKDDKTNSQRNSESPVQSYSIDKQKILHANEITTSAADSGIESIFANKDDELSSDTEVKQEAMDGTDNSKIEDDEEVTDINVETKDNDDNKDVNINIENAITISDDSDSLNSNSEVVRNGFSSNVFKPLNLTAFKAKPTRGLRIGLSKPKTSTRSKTNSMKSAANSTPSQTRLSMFGFQKRPVLK